ncbi:hypothetical protein [Tardiphaga sp.]|uniref:hypothetical protein n=1 Tax=Tardiphaga sp. TaxID=1926292 RepID=UPI00352AD82E
MGIKSHADPQIHPFLDGHGRVTRLFSQALLHELDVGSELWSVSRGLTRSVDTYKAMLQAADEPRRGDLDGRGNLTMAGSPISADTSFDLHRPVGLRGKAYGAVRAAAPHGDLGIGRNCHKRLQKGSWQILRMAVLDGEFARGDAVDFTGYATR